MRFNNMLILNIILMATLGWWIAFDTVSREEDDHRYDNIPNIPEPLQHSFQRDHHYDSSFQNAEPYGMVETFDTIYFDGDAEEPMTHK
jgi:hypothetical protein